MKRLILSVLVVFAIAAAVVGCTSGSTPGEPTPTATSTLTPTPTSTPRPTATPTPMLTATPTPASGNTELQGTWIGVVDGAEIMFTFSDNHWTLTDTSANGKLESGTFTLNSAANPKTIDLYFTGSSSPEEVGTTSLGIYQISGTNLTLAVAETGDARPTAFTENNNTIVLNLVKQSSSNTELEGTWIGVVDGAESMFTFSDNHWTLTDTSANGKLESGTFTLNSAANPKTIDLYFTGSSSPEEVGTTSLGIYQISGTNLTLVVAETGDARPTSLTGGNTFNLVKQ